MCFADEETEVDMQGLGRVQTLAQVPHPPGEARVGLLGGPVRLPGAPLHLSPRAMPSAARAPGDMVASLEPRRCHRTWSPLGLLRLWRIWGAVPMATSAVLSLGKSHPLGTWAAELRGTEPWAPGPRLLREAHDTQGVWVSVGGGLVQGGAWPQPGGHLCLWKSVLDLFFHEGALLPGSSLQSR